MDRRLSMMFAIGDLSSSALQNIHDERSANLPKTTIEKLPDKVLLKVFSYLPHREVGRVARVNRKWRMMASDSRLWSHVSLRPEISGLHVRDQETLLALIAVRFGPSLRYIELPIELITHTVLHELGYKAPNLTHMLMDFSTAQQLHDFSDLQQFPTKLRCMCICLSEVIFMESFMRKIYNFINGLEVLHLIGTYEKSSEEEEEEIYEVINIHKLKSAVPNLRVVNLFGISFVDDSHVEAFSSNCIQLECLSLNYCQKVTGGSLKLLLSRCKKLRCLLMNQTGLKNEHVMAAEWDKTVLQELDITSTELSTECLIDLINRVPPLRYFSAGQQDGFNDQVMREFLEKGLYKNLIAFDIDRNENIPEDLIMKFVKIHGLHLKGLVLSGIPSLGEAFWGAALPVLKNLKILVMGMPEDCCTKITQKIHIDSLMDSIANNVWNIERLEVRWDMSTLRFSDRACKAVDAIRCRCLRLKSLAMADGKYAELVRSNFERANRKSVVRNITNCHVTLVYLLLNYKDLIFN